MPTLDRGDGVHLAFTSRPGRSPMVVFLPGFMSDMTGDKATMLDAFCAERGQACLRLDYSGHGQSGGRFEEGTVGQWTNDALTIIDHIQAERLILVGSSMGGWIALLAALARPARLAALVGIAAAPDCTEELIWAAMGPAERAALARDGALRIPSAYGGEQIFTKSLIEDGRRHLLLGAPIPLACPIRLLHGMNDPDVPWETSLRLARRLDSADIRITLVKDGDHRLSRPRDLALLRHEIGLLLDQDRA